MPDRFVRYAVIGAHDDPREVPGFHVLYTSQRDAMRSCDSANDPARIVHRRRDEYGNMVDVDDPKRPYRVVRLDIAASIREAE